MSGSWAHSSGSLAAFISSRVTFISGASHGEHVSDGCTRGLILTGHAPGRGAIGPDSSRAALRPSSSALGPGFKVYAAVSSAMAARVGSPSAAGRGEETRTAKILARARNAVVVLARAGRGGCRCGLVGSIVLRATFSPAAALLQLLVVRLLAAFFVLHICGATGHCWPHAAVLAAGLCWCLDVMDCSIVMSETQSSLIIVPGFICKSVVACWHNQHEGWLHQRVWRARPPDLADLSCTWERPLRDLPFGVRIVETPASSYQDERRQQTRERCVAAAVLLAEWRACGSW